LIHVLLDTNIVLDVLCNRTPFAEPAKVLWNQVVAEQIQASLVATSLTNVFYIARKTLGTDGAFDAVRNLVGIFDILPIDRAVLEAALAHPSRDFEDAVQDAAAELAGIPIVVTRDPSGFAGSSRRVIDAATLVAELEAGPS
jgi:predicted nucleic acid-binding protein